uniref:Retrotransposon protein-like n=1 Tax=Oryza glaberrima TaxID=4538 RepID=A0A679BCV1_ORYGL|nr:retrotransposon protein-like [Oryza glaberrima]
MATACGVAAVTGRIFIMVDPKSADVNPENIISITVDKLTSEQKAELEDIMNKVQNQYLHSFVQTRSGTVVQRYKVALPNNEDPESSSGMNKEIKQEETPIEPKNLQDQIDYAVHSALINQSGVLVNTLTNMIKSLVDDTITEHQAKGPIFLPEGVFP